MYCTKCVCIGIHVCTVYLGTQITMFMLNCGCRYNIRVCIRIYIYIYMYYMYICMCICMYIYIYAYSRRSNGCQSIWWRGHHAITLLLGMPISASHHSRGNARTPGFARGIQGFLVQGNNLQENKSWFLPSIVRFFMVSLWSLSQLFNFLVQPVILHMSGKRWRKRHVELSIAEGQLRTPCLGAMPCTRDTNQLCV